MVGCSGAQINLSVKYAIRLPANDCLERDIAELLMRPVGRPSHKPVVCYQGFLYQAASWKTARRVVAKVEFRAGELFPRVGFIMTNLETDTGRWCASTTSLTTPAVSRNSWFVFFFLLAHPQAGYGRAVDQGGQAGAQDDPAELPSLSVERGAAGVEHVGVQPGEPVAAAGTCEGD